MSKYYPTWIVVLTPKVQGNIVAALVNEKISVEPLSYKGTMIHDENIENLSAYTLGLRLMSSEKNVEDFRNKVVAALKSKGIKYLSLICVEGDGSNTAWHGSTYSYEVPDTFTVNAGPYRSSN